MWAYLLITVMVSISTTLLMYVIPASNGMLCSSTLQARLFASSTVLRPSHTVYTLHMSLWFTLTFCINGTQWIVHVHIITSVHVCKLGPKVYIYGIKSVLSSVLVCVSVRLCVCVGRLIQSAAQGSEVQVRVLYRLLVTLNHWLVIPASNREFLFRASLWYYQL